MRFVDLPPQFTLSIRQPITMDQIAQSVGSFTSEVFDHISRQGLDTFTAPFTRYFVDGSGVELEAGWILSEPVRGAGRIKTGELPAGPAAMETHRGDYARLYETGQALRKAAEKEGKRLTGPNWEVYRKNQADADDPAQWETDIYAPVAGRKS